MESSDAQTYEITVTSCDESMVMPDIEITVECVQTVSTENAALSSNGNAVSISQIKVSPTFDGPMVATAPSAVNDASGLAVSPKQSNTAVRVTQDLGIHSAFENLVSVALQSKYSDMLSLTDHTYEARAKIGHDERQSDMGFSFSDGDAGPVKSHPIKDNNIAAATPMGLSAKLGISASDEDPSVAFSCTNVITAINSGGDCMAAPMNTEGSTALTLRDLNSISAAKPYICTVCDKAFNKLVNLQRHCQRHTSERPFKCLQCEKAFLTEQYLKVHTYIHTGERPNKCDLCGKAFRLKQSLKKHCAKFCPAEMNIANDEKACPSTEIPASSKIKPLREKKHQCSVCGMRFLRPCQLEHHSCVHSKAFKCSVCEESFTNEPGLIKHDSIIHKGTMPYICPCCGKGYRTAVNLRNHSRIHNRPGKVMQEYPVGVDEKIFKCAVCGREVTSHWSLIKHMRIHNGNQPFGCGLCERRFSQRRDLVKHMTVHTGVKAFNCNFCGKAFTGPDTLRTHCRKKHTDMGGIEGTPPVVLKPYTCNVCGRQFSESGNLMRHRYTHLNKNEYPEAALKWYKCETCTKSFMQSSDLKRHMRTHTKEKPYLCPVCQKGCTDSGNLKKHLQIHSSEKPYVCPTCSKGFSNAGYLKKHSLACIKKTTDGLYDGSMKLAHVFESHADADVVTEEQFLYLCAFCNTMYNTPEELEICVQTHVHTSDQTLTNGNSQVAMTTPILPSTKKKCHKILTNSLKPKKEQTFLCSICDQGFTSKWSLHNHKRVHSGDQLYDCKHCDKKFNLKREQLRHVSSHTGVKPFKCDICDLTFTTASIMRRHTMRHVTGAIPVNKEPKLYICNQCGREFKETSKLRRHEFTHSDKRGLADAGVKLYKCQNFLCEKEFIQSSDLKRHMRTHTGEKPYLCNACGKGFADVGHHKKHAVICGKQLLSCMAAANTDKAVRLRPMQGQVTVPIIYLCMGCGMQYQTAEEMEQCAHLNAQTEQRQSCGLCGETFMFGGELAEHISSAHSVGTANVSIIQGMTTIVVYHNDVS